MFLKLILQHDFIKKILIFEKFIINSKGKEKKLMEFLTSFYLGLLDLTLILMLCVAVESGMVTERMSKTFFVKSVK